MSEPKTPTPTPAGDTYKGWVFKWTNYIKGYQRRWFVLSNGLLSYYRYASCQTTETQITQWRLQALSSNLSNSSFTCGNYCLFPSVNGQIKVKDCYRCYVPRKHKKICQGKFSLLSRTQAEMGHTCRGTINLATATITVDDACNFVISNGGAQTYHLKASCEVERQRWITALELAKAKAARMQAESGKNMNIALRICEWHTWDRILMLFAVILIIYRWLWGWLLSARGSWTRWGVTQFRSPVCSQNTRQQGGGSEHLQWPDFKAWLCPPEVRLSHTLCSVYALVLILKQP